MVELVSVHFPKAGGTSVRQALGATYGSALLLDYDEDPANPLSPRNLDPSGYFRLRRVLATDVRAVHGHFHVDKYTGSEAYRFTLLRHPVDTLISIYFFWRSLPDGGPLHRYATSHDLDLEALAQVPLLQHLMSRTYFGGADMTSFDLVGRHELRQAHLARLGRDLGTDLAVDVTENVTPFTEDRGDVEADQPLRRRLTDLLVDDVRFYERWARAYD